MFNNFWIKAKEYTQILQGIPVDNSSFPSFKNLGLFCVKKIFTKNSDSTFFNTISFMFSISLMFSQDTKIDKRNNENMQMYLF